MSRTNAILASCLIAGAAILTIGAPVYDAVVPLERQSNATRNTLGATAGVFIAGALTLLQAGSKNN